LEPLYTKLYKNIKCNVDISGAAADQIDIEKNFQVNFIDEYQKQYKSNNNEHFSSAEEMREFFEDGIGILNWFKKKRSKYFSKRGWHLVGCEIPIVIAPNKRYNNILYMGYLDIVMYHELTDTFKIIDIKPVLEVGRIKIKKMKTNNSNYFYINNSFQNNIIFH
jgi:hypothetical protein